MKIRMNSTQMGSPNGIKVHEFVEDQEYAVDGDRLSESLAASFLANGMAVKVGGKAEKPAKPAETAAEAAPAPEEKAIAGAPENKAAKLSRFIKQK